MDVKRELESYKERRARLAVLDETIKRCIEGIAEEERRLPPEPWAPAIKALGAVSYDAMPRRQVIHGTVEGGSDPETPRLRDLRTELSAAYREQARLKPGVDRLTAALSGLAEKPRLALELHYFERLPAGVIVERFADKYRYFPSRRTVSELWAEGFEIIRRLTSAAM